MWTPKHIPVKTAQRPRKRLIQTQNGKVTKLVKHVGSFIIECPFNNEEEQRPSRADDLSSRQARKPSKLPFVFKTKIN